MRYYQQQNNNNNKKKIKRFHVLKRKIIILVRGKKILKFRFFTYIVFYFSKQKLLTEVQILIQKICIQLQDADSHDKEQIKIFFFIKK